MERDQSSDTNEVDLADVKAENLVIYALPQGFAVAEDRNDIDLLGLWDIVWKARWRIASIAALFAAASLGYALSATEWFQAEAILMPASEAAQPGIGGQFGGLAALAGLNPKSNDAVEAIATLRSRELAGVFIDANDLLPTFFPKDWDAKHNRWHDDDPDNWPDTRDAINYFHEDVLTVSPDAESGLIILTVDWVDPDLAANWATQLVGMVNAKLRDRALRESEANATYLRQELSGTNIVSQQQAISSLLENELQKLMLAKGNEEFAFRVVDAPIAARHPIRPNRVFLLIAGTMLGVMTGLMVAFLGHANSSRRERIP